MNLRQELNGYYSNACASKAQLMARNPLHAVFTALMRDHLRSVYCLNWLHHSYLLLSVWLCLFMFILFVEFGHLGDREQDLLQADTGGWRWAQDLLVQGAEGGRPHTGENGWMDGWMQFQLLTIKIQDKHLIQTVWRSITRGCSFSFTDWISDILQILHRLKKEAEIQ